MGQIIGPRKPIPPMKLAGCDPVVLQARQGMDVFPLRVDDIAKRTAVAQPLQFLIGLEIRIILQQSEDHARFFLDLTTVSYTHLTTHPIGKMLLLYLEYTILQNDLQEKNKKFSSVSS